MKKTIILCVILAAFCACDKWGKSDAAFDKNAPSLAFQELKITWSGAISSESNEKTLSVDYGKNIDIAIKHYEQPAGLKGECTGSAKLADEDYAEVLTLLDKAHLDIYFPGPNCDPLLGTTGVGISYLLTDGTNKEYSTLCEMPDQIKELMDFVDGLAAANVTDCTEESFRQLEGNPLPAEFCAESSNDNCGNDSDCAIGCHSLCHSVQNPPEGYCTLNYRECEDYGKYEVDCGCVDGKCRWR